MVTDSRSLHNFANVSNFTKTKLIKKIMSISKTKSRKTTQTVMKTAVPSFSVSGSRRSLQQTVRNGAAIKMSVISEVGSIQN